MWLTADGQQRTWKEINTIVISHSFPVWTQSLSYLWRTTPAYFATFFAVFTADDESFSGWPHTEEVIDVYQFKTIRDGTLTESSEGFSASYSTHTRSHIITQSGLTFYISPGLGNTTYDLLLSSVILGFMTKAVQPDSEFMILGWRDSEAVKQSHFHQTLKVSFDKWSMNQAMFPQFFEGGRSGPELTLKYLSF